MEGEFRNVEVKPGVIDLFFRALFPHHCVACEKEGEVLCSECFEELKSPRKGLFACALCGTATPLGVACDARKCRAAPLDGLLSVAPYSDRTLRRLLQLWKYERVESAGRVLIEIFSLFLERHRALMGIVAQDAKIIPVPLAFFRRATRGFNQSEALARSFGKVMHASVAMNLLRRSHGRQSQAAIQDRRARTENVVGIFHVTSRVREGGRYVLIDDVATSSATLQECARILKKSGAGSVWGITLLRG